MFPYFHDKLFCSPACRAEFRDSAVMERWLSGTVTSLNIPNFVRRYLFKINDNKCSKCGWSEVHPVTGTVPLTINHIDGDATNHSPNNLELICPNCHSLTPNYCGLNMGHGREQRRMKRIEKKAAGRLFAD
jgi:5-methylcytosine-specific restriction endonuclease McrA